MHSLDLKHKDLVKTRNDLGLIDTRPRDRTHDVSGLTKANSGIKQSVGPGFVLQLSKGIPPI